MGAQRTRRNRRRKTRAVNIRALDRRTRAIELRREGKTFKEIGELLGVSAPAVFKMVTKTLDAANALLVTEAKELRQRQLDRVESLLHALWKASQDGQVGKIDRVVKLMEREAKLAGLDAPNKYEHGGPDGGPIQVTDARARLAEKVAFLAKKRTEGG